MFEKVSKYLLEKKDEVVFSNLKPGKKIDINGYTIDSNFRIPMLTADLVKKVKENEDEDIDVRLMVNAMVKVIGIDNNFVDANRYKEFLLKFDPKIGDKILKNGLYYASKKNYMEALVHMSAAYEFKNDDLNVLYNYAKLCDELAEIRKDEPNESNDFLQTANEVFNYITEKYPSFPDSYYYLGFHFAMESKFNKAKEYFKIAIDNGIDDNKKTKIIELIKDLDDKSDFERGSELVMNGRFQEGLEKLLPLEEFHNDWWNLLFFIGLAYRHLQKYDKAIGYFKRTLEYNSGHCETYNELGIACLSIGHINDAKKAYEEALKIDPDNHELLCNIAIVYLNEENYKEAERYLLKAKKAKSDDEIVDAWLKKLEELKKN